MLPDLTGITPKCQVLIGIDLMAQFKISIPIPPRQRGLDVCRCDTRQASEERFCKFLKVELPKFDNIRGPTTAIEHRIRLKTTMPIKQRYRPRNSAMQAIIDKEVDEMERAGIIEPSASP